MASRQLPNLLTQCERTPCVGRVFYDIDDGALEGSCLLCSRPPSILRPHPDRRTHPSVAEALENQLVILANKADERHQNYTRIAA